MEDEEYGDSDYEQNVRKKWNLVVYKLRYKQPLGPPYVDKKAQYYF